MSRWVIAGLIAWGCALPQGPLFSGITKITVQKVGATGLVRKELSPAELKPVVQCLNGKTHEVTVEQTADELLVTTYLIEVTDSQGSRSFELYTAKNLKGNHGKYYENPCLYDQIVKMEL